MLKEDLDKMINCRKAIDEARKASQERVEKISALPVDSQKLAKAQLESDRTKATEKCLAVMKENGFSNAWEFAGWYNKKILELYKEHRPIKGLCDWCGLKKFGTQPCAKIVGINPALSCAAVKDGSTINAIYRWALEQERTVGLKTICPNGHGYQQDVDKYTEPPEGVDFNWKV